MGIVSDLRTTTRVSPGRQPSVWERWAMVVVVVVVVVVAATAQRQLNRC